jgi:hypothetical protein
VGAHDKTLARLKTAAGENPFMPKPPPFGQNSPTGGQKRDIPKDHPYDPRALKPMAKMLWAMSVSLGHALTAYRQFTRLKSVTISPDGLIGGRGYVMGVKEVRQKLYEACEALSLISDTVHDEISGPHWKPRLAQLDMNDAEDVSRFIEESQRLLDNPEEEPEEEMKSIEEANDKGPGKTPKQMAPAESAASKMPGAGVSTEENHAIPKQANALTQEIPLSALKLSDDELAKRALYEDFYRKPPVREASQPDPLVARVVNRHLANSSIPVDGLGGPRVDHIGPGEGQGPGGTYNRNEPPVADEWSETEGRGDSTTYDITWAELTNRTSEHYTEKCAVCQTVISQCRCMSHNKVTRYGLCDSCKKDAASGIPDSNTEPTPTQGWDFGIGLGKGDDAHGQGAGGYSESNPDTGMSGTNGPASGLPKNPGGATHDHKNEDTTPEIDMAIAPAHNIWAAAELPNDDQDPVARSDYFEGPKGGLVSQSGMPGDESVSYNADRDLPGAGNTFERTDNPYIKWDDSTKNYRPDMTYQRTTEGSHNG